MLLVKTTESCPEYNRELEFLFRDLHFDAVECGVKRSYSVCLDYASESTAGGVIIAVRFKRTL